MKFKMFVASADRGVAEIESVMAGGEWEDRIVVGWEPPRRVDGELLGYVCHRTIYHGHAPSRLGLTGQIRPSTNTRVYMLLCSQRLKACVAIGRGCGT